MRKRKSFFSFYGTHQGQHTSVNHTLWTCARLNAHIVIGIDLIYCPPSNINKNPKNQFPGKKVIIYLYTQLIYIRWLAREVGQGRFIIPTLLICNIFASFRFLLPTIYDQKTVQFQGLHAQLDRLRFRDENIATFIRYISSVEDEFRINRANVQKLQDFYFRLYIYQIILSILFRNSVNSYFTVYSSYLHSYMPCEAAVRNKIPVIVFGCSHAVFLSSENKVPSQINWFENSCCLTDLTDCRSSRYRSLGNSILKKRINGNLDVLVSYMTTSAYTNSPNQVIPSNFNKGNFKLATETNTINPFVVIYMHEFYDFHHNGVLPGFAESYYEWLLITLKIMHLYKVNYRLKLHPCITSNPQKYSQSIDVLSYLSDKFSEPIIISINETTKQLCQQGMTLGCTVRGTIALELIYQGIPVICSGNPPFANFLPSRCLDDLELYTNSIINHSKAFSVTPDEIQSVCKYTGLSFLAREGYDKDSLDLVKKNKIRLVSHKHLQTIKKYL